MFKYIFDKSRYLLVLSLFVITPIKAWGGHTLVGPDTDFPEDQLYFYWDLRDRESFFQVTNDLPDPVIVHIQVFNAATGCTEFDFCDSFTGNDTHVYNLRNLTSNDGSLTGPPDLTDGFGFVVVSTVPGPVCPDPAGELGAIALIGNFRIIDNSGYEYRANAVGNVEGNVEDEFGAAAYTFNFNDIDGTAFADVVGIPVWGDFTSNVLADPFTFHFFNVSLFNLEEDHRSCSPVVFACDPDFFNYGINQAIINSRGGNSLCLGTDTNGYVNLVVDDANADFFVGFIGLNNGDGTGSMDAWWLTTFFTTFPQ